MIFITQYKALFSLAIALLLMSCKVNTVNQLDMSTKPVVTVTADKETTPVTISGDAADDPCIWINPKDVHQSRIIATNKKEGLEVYDLDGNIIKRYKVGKVNNVDIRYGFSLNGTEYPVVTASNRTNNTISIFIVQPTGDLVEMAARPIQSTLQPIYGLGMYKNTKTNKMYVYVVGKRGGIEQWLLYERDNKIDAKLVRELHLTSKAEGIVVDDYHDTIYIAQEDKGLWKFAAAPDAAFEKVLVIRTTDINMKDDFEGVTLYDMPNGQGYIIVSSQGNNSYAVFDRVSNQYKGSFSIEDAANVDGTTDTDGIDVTSVPVGDKFPKGFFIAQDYENITNGLKHNQNFKIVNWQKIAEKLNLAY